MHLQKQQKLVALYGAGRHAEVQAAARRELRKSPQSGFAWKILGASLQAAGRLDEACTAMRRACDALPDDAEALFNLGNVQRDRGHAEEALACFVRALQLQPEYPEALCNLGNLLTAQGDHETAELMLRQAVALRPTYAAARLNLANLLIAAARHDDARSECRELLEIAPGWSAAHHAMARSFEPLGNMAEAEQAYRCAWALDRTDLQVALDLIQLLLAQKRPGDAEPVCRSALQSLPCAAQLHLALARVLQDCGAAAEAEQSCRRAIELDPGLAAAHFTLGNIFNASGRLPEAEAAFRQALGLRADWAEVHANLGMVLRAAGRCAEAQASCMVALALKPELAEALSTLGSALFDAGRSEEAVACFRRYVAIRPDEALGHSNLGAGLYWASCMDEAEASLRGAIQCDPDFVDAYSNLGCLLSECGRLVEARDCYEKALALSVSETDRGRSYDELAYIHAYLSDYRRVVEFSDRAMECLPNTRVADYRWERRLYAFSYHADLSAADIFREFRRWGETQAQRVQPMPRRSRPKGRRLRVGLVSPDFRRHTSRFYFAPLLEHYDRERVEFVAYSNVKAGDEWTDWFRGHVDQWRDIRNLSDADAAAMIERDGIDVLLDGCNHMRDHRLGIFALKPAPVQATWLGAAWTTGLTTVDYVIFDPFMAPPDTLTTERIVRLPGCFVAFRPPEDTPPVASLPALARGHLTFGYSGRTERLNHRCFRAWGELLRRLPTARLILDYKSFGNAPTRDYYMRFMAEHGVDTSRVDMRYSSRILEALADVDVMLDCFPHSGGTMLFDGLWMGVPAVTLTSRPPVGRIGTSIMRNIGLHDWVVGTEEEYVQRACEIATDIPALAAIRAGMRDRMRNSPLMDERRFALDFSEALLRMSPGLEAATS